MWDASTSKWPGTNNANIGGIDACLISQHRRIQAADCELFLPNWDKIRAYVYDKHATQFPNIEGSYAGLRDSLTSQGDSKVASIFWKRHWIWLVHHGLTYFNLLVNPYSGNFAWRKNKIQFFCCVITVPIVLICQLHF
jgi:hypothetical protein